VPGASPVPAHPSDGHYDEAARRRRLVQTLTAQLGSRREASWIIDHAGPEQAQALADRRSAGEPLQYVLGRWPFRSLDLKVDPRVLVPRPETEQVVEVALRELACSEHRRRVAAMAAGLEADVGPICVDLGTGSGAIALSMAVEGGRRCPDLAVWATDVSDDALAVARENREALVGVDAGAAGRVQLAPGWWFDALPCEILGRVDLVVANPPYVAESEFPGLDPSVRGWEPKVALVAANGAGGVGGLASIEAIIDGALRWLSRSGAMVMEIAPTQAEASVVVARRAGFADVGVERDLSGRLRTLVARRSP
jgi:release factor glutamine methyltransferase